MFGVPREELQLEIDQPLINWDVMLYGMAHTIKGLSVLSSGPRRMRGKAGGGDRKTLDSQLIVIPRIAERKKHVQTTAGYHGHSSHRNRDTIL
jgi:hypothetical protein